MNCVGWWQFSWTQKRILFFRIKNSTGRRWSSAPPLYSLLICPPLADSLILNFGYQWIELKAAAAARVMKLRGDLSFQIFHPICFRIERTLDRWYKFGLERVRKQNVILQDKQRWMEKFVHETFSPVLFSRLTHLILRQELIIGHVGTGRNLPRDGSPRIILERRKTTKKIERREERWEKMDHKWWKKTVLFISMSQRW